MTGYCLTPCWHTITDQHLADAFAHETHCRRSPDLQGIAPETLVALTDEGRTMVNAIIHGWVRMLRLPPDERVLSVARHLVWEVAPGTGGCSGRGLGRFWVGFC